MTMPATGGQQMVMPTTTKLGNGVQPQIITIPAQGGAQQMVMPSSTAKLGNSAQPQIITIPANGQGLTTAKPNLRGSTVQNLGSNPQVQTITLDPSNAGSLSNLFGNNFDLASLLNNLGNQKVAKKSTGASTAAKKPSVIKTVASKPSSKKSPILVAPKVAKKVAAPVKKVAAPIRKSVVSKKIAKAPVHDIENNEGAFNNEASHNGYGFAPINNTPIKNAHAAAAPKFNNAEAHSETYAPVEMGGSVGNINVAPDLSKGYKNSLAPDNQMPVQYRY
jgi:hypothetical protein